MNNTPCERAQDLEYQTSLQKQWHPAMVFRGGRVNKIHVTLTDMTDTPKLMWDAVFQGGAGGPGKLTHIDPPKSGDLPKMVPFCFKNGLQDVDFNKTRYLLKVESVPMEGFRDVKHFVNRILLRPRPLCDVVVTSNQPPLSDEGLWRPSPVEANAGLLLSSGKRTFLD
jgi:hypothetical protein